MEVPQVILPNTVLIPGADLVDLNVVGASNVGIEDEMGKIAQEGIEENLSEEIFSNYQHQEIIPGCQPHPGDIVEAGPLSSLSLPPPSYPLTDSLPQDVISSGRLSSLQLEGILYSCQRHQTILNSGQRAGFFIGDGAGVGKGRQIAGIILDNFARGRTKHVWFSISADLIVDARRDLIDIGCFVKVIKGCQELDRETRVLGLPSDFKEGVVFSTYCTLVSSVQRGSAIINSSKQSRLKQLIDWCGGEKFEGCLIFDECHKAKNFVPENEHASTKVSMAVMTIQRLLPKARVVYCSATGVCDVKNMAFMERLGLWGEGAPFSSFENFIDAIHRKGLGAAEMLAMEMKTAGMYISRGLSFKQAEFLTVEAALTKEQVKMYDLSAHMWNELRKGLQIALQRTGSVNSRLWLQFWSSHQRFFKQLCMGMKVPVIIREAKTALDSGHSVVIGLQTTGEASLESELGKCKGDLQRFVSLCREIFLRFVIQYFPVKIEGKDNVEPQDDNWCVKAKERLVEFGQKIDLPDSPLDEIIDKFGGPDQVAEMTGRRGRVVRTSVKELPRYELRGSGPDSVREISSLNVRERNSFMDGKKLIAIISDAASTGISLHADLRVGNQRRREHLTIELPWSADKAVQQLGRSHRSNQSSGPLYKLVTTNLGGERRFAAAVARRLQSLGALTKGDRRAATGADLTTFNFDTFYGRSALKLMYRYICIGELVPGIPFALVNQEVGSLEVFLSTLQDSLVLMGLVEVGLSDTSVVVRERDSGDVRRFLNRILGLTVKKQNLIFNYFTKCLDLTIENARKEGKYNEGLLDITASSIEIVGQPQVVFKDLAKGNSVTRHVVLSIDRGMSWASACEIYKDCTGRHDGFYVSKREHFGRKLFLLAMQKDSPKHHFKIIRPNTGVSSFVVEKGDLFNKYSPISSNDAEKGWTGQYEDTKDRSMHGASRRDGRFITVGSRFYRIHLLCGSILTLMSVLEEVVARNIVRFHLSKFETTIRVVRAQLNSGERIVGIRYPEVLIPEVEKILKEHQIIKRVQMMQNCQLTQSPIRQPATVTTVSPVIPKCLSKALTPPVTIKSFFKAVGTSSANETNHQHSDRLPDLLLSNSSTSDKAGGCFRAVGTASQRNSKADFQSSGKPACRKRSQNYTQSGKGMFVKRPKQSTILASFTNLVVKEEKQETPLVLSNCPVCGEQFSSRLSNVEINAHIDSCLIE